MPSAFNATPSRVEAARGIPLNTATPGHVRSVFAACKILQAAKVVSVPQETKVARRLRASGTLIQSNRGWLLKANDEAIWVLEHEDEQEFAPNRKVIVEGEISGFDRLRVDWIGPQEEVP
ncbi:DUF5818 domain-containing protein [Novosphingobium sp.]|uniref:DUF5818 domain-containing protein n=1 Tax=Novosphingobium sp. TaxID=1874826 RepID=UPI0034593DF5